ncbi:hypothetical protein [Bacillus coahuilensis]|uniref:hypothetical protein n=1 Tax=Bacillus coahuilensis TaxID=408580 RepID=UPI0007518305|nr:hypothetical protein [Bacillus coahuilensis]
MKRRNVLFILLLLCACGKQPPEPESVTTMSIFRATQSSSSEMNIRHIVQKQNVFIECQIPSVTFSGNKDLPKAKVIAYVNNKRIGEFRTAAFVIKDLPEGNHHIKLEVLSDENETLGLEKQFFVWITE